MTLAGEAHVMFRAEQDRLVAAFQGYDGCGRFRDSEWRRDDLGGGRARVLERGRVFERAGVNVSLVNGATVPASIAQNRPHVAGRPFTATGISMVLHPVNPYAPSFHANFRLFTVGSDVWWFGGGCDLTPTYGFDEDAVHFHRTIKSWCDEHDESYYPAWKQKCDEYFTVRHRNEMRGIGGVFFDGLTDERPEGFERCRSLVADGLNSVLRAYVPILDRRCGMPYGPRQRDWQLIRRGRYVEFNLVYDRGTHFGLQTRGNTEAILMSLPPLASWGYEVEPPSGSPEADVSRFLQPRSWAEQGDLVLAEATRAVADDIGPRDGS